jgi:hypothetical protein
MSFKTRQPDLETATLPVEEEEVATHQEAVPLPYVAGTRKVAVRWLGPATALITRQAPKEKTGKK